MIRGNLKAHVKLAAMLAWTALCYLPIWLAWKRKNITRRDALVRWYYRGLLRIIGVRLKISGQLAENRPLMLVTNHLSYLDVPIIASAANVRFTPKSEIAAWPLIKNICRLGDAIFIDRDPKMLSQMKERLLAALGHDETICLFPEATTGNGLHMQTFKSGFFNLAEEPINGKPLHIQPAAITYTHIRGLPIDFTQWPLIAWYGDMDLFPHFMELLKIAPIEVEITFLPTVTVNEYPDRKALAAHCQRVIEDTIESVRHRPFHIKKTTFPFNPRLLRATK